MLSQFQQAIQNKTVQGYFPIVFAMVAQAMGLSKADTLYAFYYNAAVAHTWRETHSAQPNGRAGYSV